MFISEPLEQMLQNKLNIMIDHLHSSISNQAAYEDQYEVITSLFDCVYVV